MFPFYFYRVFNVNSLHHAKPSGFAAALNTCQNPRLQPGMLVWDRQTWLTSKHLLPARQTVLVVEICPRLFSCSVCACLGHWENHGRSLKLVFSTMKTLHPQHSTSTVRSPRPPGAHSAFKLNSFQAWEDASLDVTTRRIICRLRSSEMLCWMLCSYAELTFLTHGLGNHGKRFCRRAVCVRRLTKLLEKSHGLMENQQVFFCCTK